MSSLNWQNLMRSFNDALLNSQWMKEEAEEYLSEEDINQQWLGNPGATITQIIQAENRLGISLPPSYKEFLQFSNGWRLASHSVYELFSVEQIDWFRTLNPEWVEIVQEYYPGEGDISDEDYTKYDNPKIRTFYFRLDHVEKLLQISNDKKSDNTVYLLNPQMVDAKGEWETWRIEGWGETRRFASFWDLIQTEYTHFVRIDNARKR